jgi:hypothetical protein
VSYTRIVASWRGSAGSTTSTALTSVGDTASYFFYVTRNDNKSNNQRCGG